MDLEISDKSCVKTEIKTEIRKPRRSKYKQPDLEIISRTLRQTTLNGFIKSEPKVFKIEELTSEIYDPDELEKQRYCSKRSKSSKCVWNLKFECIKTYFHLIRSASIFQSDRKLNFSARLKLLQVKKMM